jgi:formate hydrogenlyase transcriptional activator
MSETEHYRALLEVGKAILAHTALFRQLSQSLSSLLKLDFVGLALHEPARQGMRTYTIATPKGIDVPQQPLVIHDLMAEARFPRAVRMMRSVGAQSFCILPLTTSLRRIGGMGFGRLQSVPFDDG